MTAHKIRDIGYLAWQNDWAWMESMKGVRWNALIKQEKAQFNKLASQPNVEKLARQMEDELHAIQPYLHMEGFSIACGNIFITLGKSDKIFWRWKWSKKLTKSYDIDYEDNHVWYTTTEDADNYKNSLICESLDGKRIWVKKEVAYQVAVKDDVCYYIKVEDYFRTVELCCCNAKTGRNPRILYKERDEKRDLTLAKGSNKTLYLISSSVTDNKLWKIAENRLHQLDTKSVIQIPLGESIQGDDCRLVKYSHDDAAWSAKGAPIDKWILPKDNILWVNIQNGIILTADEGEYTLWQCAIKSKPKLIFKVPVGLIIPNTWAVWEGEIVQTFIVKSPYEPPYLIHIANDKLMKETTRHTIMRPIRFTPLEVHRLHATSRDGTKVPYISVAEKGAHIQGVLVYVYGAYGTPSAIGWPYEGWYPILKRGWAIVYALIRGGGDKDEAWANAPRREARYKAVDDFEAVIKAAQRYHRVKPSQVVIYGRSAGGLQVGAIVSRYPYGNLVGAAFTEVPYVDVLRTTTNPELPLTIGEYDEFGNPLERIKNFEAIMNVSPIDTLGPEGAPGVFVITRTGLQDRQVYPYEPFKWIQRLRGFMTPREREPKEHKGKFITYEKDEGHVYSPGKDIRSRAIDLAILDSWLHAKLDLR